MRFIYTIFILVFWASSLSAQCVGFQIEVDESSICAPGLVRFNVLNSISGSTYVWNVGNGPTVSSDTLFSYYTVAGIIDAFVEITLPNGTVCTVSEMDILQVNEKPNPIFSTSNIRVCDLTKDVTLTDITPNSASRSWVVDQTNFSNTDTFIKHSFVSPGLKTLSLVVVDSNGCQGVSEFKDAIMVYKNPDFSYSINANSGCVPVSIAISFDRNPNLGGLSKSYLWTFNDDPLDTTSAVEPLARSFSETSNFKVKLEVNVSNGCNYVLEKVDSVDAGDTVDLNVIVDNPTPCRKDEVRIIQTNDTLSGDVIWNFSGVSHQLLSSNNDSVVLRTIETGKIGLVLEYNQNGCITRKEYNELLEVKGVIADFKSSNSYNCVVPHTVDLIDSSNKLDANTLFFNWRILRGTSSLLSSTQMNPSFTFTDFPASYDVELAVLGDNGCTDTMLKSGFIYQEPMTATFTAFPMKGCVNQSINFRNLTKPSTFAASDSFKWYFFDKDGSTILDSSKQFSPVRSYSDTGFYDVLLIGYNSLGCTDTLRVDDAVEIIHSVLDYSISDTIFCVADKLDLVGNSAPLDVNFGYTWTFRNTDSPSQRYTSSGKFTGIRIPEIGRYEAIVTHNIVGGCLVSDTFFVHANGVKASIVVDSFNACVPLDIMPRYRIDVDKFEGEIDSSYDFLWTAPEGSGITVQNTLTVSPTVRFTRTGDYNIGVRIKNSAGCFFNGLSDTLELRNRAPVLLADNRICLGDSLSVLNSNYDNISDLNWTLEPSGKSTIYEKSSDEYIIAIDSQGVYYLDGVITADGNCIDTTGISFEVIKVKAEFVAVDSFLVCAPIYAEFESSSVNADTLIWHFGIGDTSKTLSSSSGHIYQNNSGFDNGFDITLIAKSVEGCADTSIRENYVVVAGPVPFFEMTNNVGCEPLEVNFIDQSLDVSLFYLDYNDGTDLDTSKDGNIIGSHSYTVEGANDNRQAILPSMLVYDSLGCPAIFEPEDSVIIYKTPIAFPVFDALGGCTPFTLTFNDTSKSLLRRFWLYDGNQISDKISDSLTEDNIGVHPLSLVVQNGNNCFDTSVTEFEVLESPLVSFYVDDTLCIKRLTAFMGQVQAKDSVNYFSWHFGEEGLIENFNTQDIDPLFTYTTSGQKTITFTAELSNGCTDSSIQNVIITDEKYIDSPPIDFISFDEGYELTVKYQKSTIPKFNKYILNTPNGLQEIWEQDSLIFTQDLVVEPSTPPCYSLIIGDYCDLKGSESATHCAMLLSVSNAIPYQHVLTWTEYVGWGGVSEYQIFRQNEEGVFIKIGEVDGSVTTYEDLYLCNQPYTYFVRAISPTSNEITSRTYNVSQTPTYIYNEERSSIDVVSVESDNTILVRWSESQFSNFDRYKVSKYEEDINNPIDVFYTTDTFLIDAEVNVNETSYLYTVTEVDLCGYENLVNREGKSILLTGEYQDGSKLSWTEYVNWKNGVSVYNLEISKPFGFDQVIQTQRNVTDYFDDMYYRDIRGAYCYKAHAVNSSGDTSYSNVACVIGSPKVDIPSAFSPNGDNLNDLFNPITQFTLLGEVEELNSYYFEIYTRWGEKIYSTNNVGEGWDGTYRDAECQQGAYIYVVKAKGLDGTVINLDGTVTLLR